MNNNKINRSKEFWDNLTDIEVIEELRREIPIFEWSKKRYFIISEVVYVIGFFSPLWIAFAPGNVSWRSAVISKTSMGISEKWIPSGIYRNENSWLYVIGNEYILFIFSKILYKG